MSHQQLQVLPLCRDCLERFAVDSYHRLRLTLYPSNTDTADGRGPGGLYVLPEAAFLRFTRPTESSVTLPPGDGSNEKGQLLPTAAQASSLCCTPATEVPPLLCPCVWRPDIDRWWSAVAGIPVHMQDSLQKIPVRTESGTVYAKVAHTKKAQDNRRGEGAQEEEVDLKQKSYMNAAPFLLISGETVDCIGRTLGLGRVQLDIERFRANFVVAGAPPFWELRWVDMARVRLLPSSEVSSVATKGCIGVGIWFRVGSTCIRCSSVNVAPTTSLVDPSLLAAINSVCKGARLSSIGGTGLGVYLRWGGEMAEQGSGRFVAIVAVGMSVEVSGTCT
eukprot:GHVS01040110.1.p1 GENE.GHVS01040110.1~~GHVS01040110.1.p1  ORF type:complete len:362 (-),score=36.74 GHVS01040110.1:47-1045(-)